MPWNIVLFYYTSGFMPWWSSIDDKVWPKANSNTDYDDRAVCVYNFNHRYDNYANYDKYDNSD